MVDCAPRGKRTEFTSIAHGWECAPWSRRIQREFLDFLTGIVRPLTISTCASTHTVLEVRMLDRLLWILVATIGAMLIGWIARARGKKLTFGAGGVMLVCLLAAYPGSVAGSSDPWITFAGTVVGLAIFVWDLTRP